MKGYIALQAIIMWLIALKNCAPFTKCIAKIDGTAIDEIEDLLDLFMPMYSLREYSINYSETAESLWFYSKNEATNFNADTANDANFKSFKYKAKLLENIEADGANGILKNATIAVPLKYLRNFLGSLQMPLINCKVELRLKSTNYHVLSAAGADNTNANQIILFSL